MPTGYALCSHFLLLVASMWTDVAALCQLDKIDCRGWVIFLDIELKDEKKYEYSSPNCEWAEHKL